jgi:nucleoside permease NupC
MSFNVLGESIYDIACLLLCRLSASLYVKNIGIRFSDKKLTELEESITHIAKVIIFSYNILSTYPKHVIATSLLMAVLTTNNLMSPFLKERVIK